MVVQHALRALRLSARSLGAGTCGGTGARPPSTPASCGGTGAQPPSVPASCGGTGARPPSVPATCGAPGAAPTCAPCGPRPPPPCRALHPTTHKGIRVVCCPQRPAKPPPCPPTNCTLSCSNMTHQTLGPIGSEASRLVSGGQDCVAWRLQYAERLRRLDYEEEVAGRANELSPPSTAPLAPFPLGAERELARATDGRLYAISGPRPRPCCSGEPPPPSPVKLENSNSTCHISDEYIDPCAYQPRVFLEIDRSARETSSVGVPVSNISTPGHCAATCPRRPRAPRADDQAWCQNPPSYPAAPKRCRPITIVERLRARPSRLTPHTQGKGARRLHTSAAAPTATDRLQELMRSRYHLKEAGRGRVVAGHCTPQPSRERCPGGKLDMYVPTGTTGVRVRVYLDSADCGSGDNTQTAAGVSDLCQISGQKPQDPCQAANLKKEASWLCTFQKNLLECPGSKISSGCTTNRKLPMEECIRAPCPRPLCPRAPAPTANEPKSRCTSSIVLLTNTVVTGPYV